MQPCSEPLTLLLSSTHAARAPDMSLSRHWLCNSSGGRLNAVSPTPASSCQGYLSGSDKEVDAGDSREEEDHAGDGKTNGIPEVVKDPRLGHFWGQAPLGCGTAIQAKDHHCYHATHLSCTHTHTVAGLAHACMLTSIKFQVASVQTDKLPPGLCNTDAHPEQLSCSWCKGHVQCGKTTSAWLVTMDTVGIMAGSLGCSVHWHSFCLRTVIGFCRLLMSFSMD